MMKVPEHKHPLKLIDLHVNVDDLEEFDDEEEKNLVPHNEFVRPCNRCGQEINEYYRYFYKCIITDDSCNYSLHKFCAELPTWLNHLSLPYPFLLREIPYDWACFNCEAKHMAYEVGYSSPHSIYIDVICAIEVNKMRIHHPSHPHSLVSLISDPILCKCKACGKEHKGIFFQCTTCSNFAIHTDCAFLPKSMLIQDKTNAIFHHTHPLTLSYSFPLEEQSAKHSPVCRVCSRSFNYKDWIYKCEKCWYYAHLDCATSRSEPFMSILSNVSGPTFKNFYDADYGQDLLCLPFPDQTYSLLKHLFFKEIGSTSYEIDEVSLQHINHQHQLIFVQAKHIESSSSKVNSLFMCHDPMKKIQVLCNVCVQPIMEAPFYKCGAFKDESCNFALHEWCTRLPKEVNNHPGHPKHTLVLMSHVPHRFFGIFNCVLCHLPCNGFSYGCVKCKYYIDVNCGFIPENITHKSHSNHLLSRVSGYARWKLIACLMCKLPIFGRKSLYYECNTCDVSIHQECAFLLPEKVRHVYDKHPMHLSYLPIENHKSEYFCEICEHQMNPHNCFYHCDECVQSVHSTCAPLILQCETETFSYKLNEKAIYRFSKVKFGSIYKTNGHPHPLSFAQGTATDAPCSMCGNQLQYKMIFKCIECKFAIHETCCKHLKKS